MFLGSTALPPLDSESSLMKEFARMSPGKDLAQGLFLQLAESQHPPRTIKTHLPLSLLSPDLLNTAKVRKHTSFEEMKARDNLFTETQEEDVGLVNLEAKRQHGGFFRKGNTGSWRGELTEAQDHQLNLWMDRHLTPSGIHFREPVD
ncbi:putative Sulfotransferase domain-containing protein 1 [Homarus americanus]|uniref:Putative Sulfotransferase domain-containing protein 1 n=1 Tax=Homarus americanus TaxID=6706 RepID=A0A8J5MP81_HOMAM|nr:putative Sulfotransferase domain-containing protein 1 [Homarus americanus]